MDRELHEITYGDRPAYLLMWGGLFGFALHWAGWLIGGGILFILLSVGYLCVRPTLRQRMRTPLWMMAWALLFGCYCEVRTLPLSHTPSALTLYDQEVHLIHPIQSAQEQNQQLYAQIRPTPKGQPLTILLHVPPSHHLPDTLLYDYDISATLDLHPLHTLESKGYATYLYTQGYDAVAYLHDFSPIPPSSHSSWKSRLSRWRTYLIHNIEEKSGTSLAPSHRALLYALILGERSYLDKDQKVHFTEAGLSHLLALSGFHLGIIYLILSQSLRRLFPQHRHRKWRDLLTLALLVLYTLLTGAAPSTMRALLMTTLYIGARLFDRRPDGVQTLALTLLVLWSISPRLILSPGLILSASAVWGILVFYPLLERCISPRHPLTKYLYTALCVTVSAQIGVLPWTSLFWGKVDLHPLWSSLPMGLVAVVVIPLGFAVIVLGTLLSQSWLYWLVLPLRHMTEVLERGAQTFAQITLPSLSLSISLPSVALYYILCHYLLYRPLFQWDRVRSRKI